MARRFGKTADERRFGVDRAAAEMRRADSRTQRLVKVGQSVFLLLLLGFALVPRRGDASGQAVGFAMACVGMLLVSPVAWTHYYMMILPAALVVPLWLRHRGYAVASRVMAASPVVLIWGHYLAKRSVGPVGMLGLGTTAWFLAACVLGALAIFRGARNPALVGGLVSGAWKADGPHAPGLAGHRAHTSMRADWS